MWDMLSGKKTAIGALMLMLGAWIPSLGVEASWMPGLLSVLQILGTIFGGVGVTHKIQKGDMKSSG